MYYCLLCITKTSNNNEKYIFNWSPNIANLIKKYLFLEWKDENKCQIVCSDCWKSLMSFDKFFKKVQEAQKFVNLNEKSCENVCAIKIKTEYLDSNESYKNESNDQKEFELTIEGNTLNDKGLDKKEDLKRSAKAINSRNKIVRSRDDNMDKKISNFMKLFCDICAIEVSKFSEMKSHFRTEHNMLGYVTCCDKKFSKRIYLSDHIDSHLNPEEFKCNICNRIQRNHNALRQHIKVIHEKTKTFKCEICQKLLASKSALDLHKFTHIPENERKFKCANCEKGYASEVQLKAHYAKVHESLSNNICYVCGKAIKDSALFKRHQLEHEGITEPKAHCEICDIWLKNQMTLKKHIKNIHDDPNILHICPVCQKQCPTRSALKSHKFYVHSNKLFECTICKKKFKKAITLKEHMTTHTGEVLYTCPHCPKTFTSNANLHHHRKKDHRTEWELKRANSVLKRPSEHYMFGKSTKIID